MSTSMTSGARASAGYITLKKHLTKTTSFVSKNITCTGTGGACPAARGFRVARAAEDV